MKRHLATIGFGALLAGLGLAGGWYAARRGGSDAREEEQASAAAAPGVFTAQTLKRMGVRVGPARRSTFRRSLHVQAVVVDAPLNRRPVPALLGGVVEEILARPGAVVAAGTPLARVVRDPIPRPQLALTSDILAAVSEDLHRSLADYRTAVSQLGIVRAELARIEEFKEVVKGQTRIDLRYEETRAVQQLENVREELYRHGLSDADLEAVGRGSEPAADLRMLWKRALERNGLWTAEAETLFQTLPEGVRGLSWSVAALGELAAAGLATPHLTRTLKAVPYMAEHFVEVASLLLEGHTVDKVRLLAEAGALEAVAEVRAPPGAADWDVAEVAVRAGQRIEAGAVVATLHDPREMWMRIEPVGDEVRLVAEALAEGRAVAAVPLVPGTGPEIRGLSIERFATLESDRGAEAIVICPNRVLAASNGSRSWALRAGLRYLVRIPQEELENRFVLPAGAVTELGADAVVFVQSGAAFRPQPVTVEYEDDQVAVVADDGSLYEDDPVALSGAFALGLAFQGQGQGGSADPHAGHSHPH